MTNPAFLTTAEVTAKDMLAAALMFSDQLEVVLPVAYLGSEGTFDTGGSFWLRKKQLPFNS
jgi:hypothetical protein